VWSDRSGDWSIFEMGRDITASGRFDFKAEFARAGRKIGQRRVDLPVALRDKVEQSRRVIRTLTPCQRAGSHCHPTLTLF
jgi:hypothetical protein